METAEGEQLFNTGQFPSYDERRRVGWKHGLVQERMRISPGLSERLLVRLTGEKRAPRKGEWYLSGAIPAGWFAPNDLDSVFWICELVVVTIREVAVAKIKAPVQEPDSEQS